MTSLSKIQVHVEVPNDPASPSTLASEFRFGVPRKSMALPDQDGLFHLIIMDMTMTVSLSADQEP